MITNPATSVDLRQAAFLDYKGTTVADVWRHAPNPKYWRHGITISQGLGWSVSEAEATRRLNYIRVHLLRAMFGNNFRKRAKIEFLMFKQGSRATFNQHYHALMAIEGDHNWSDEQIAQAIIEIDAEPVKKTLGEERSTSIGIGSRAIDFTVTLLVMQRMTGTVTW